MSSVYLSEEVSLVICVVFAGTAPTERIPYSHLSPAGSVLLASEPPKYHSHGISEEEVSGIYKYRSVTDSMR